MTQRIPLDHLTSDDLDQLYDQRDRARQVAVALEQALAEAERNAAIDTEVMEKADRECDEHLEAGRAFRAWGEAWQERAEQAEARERELRARLADAERGTTAAIRQRKTAEDRALRAETERDRHAALLNRTTHLLGITHAHRGQGGHDVLGENLTCAGCALRDEICDALAAAGHPLPDDGSAQPAAKPTDPAAVEETQQ